VEFVEDIVARFHSDTSVFSAIIIPPMLHNQQADGIWDFTETNIIPEK
jgi:hypothetical protein